MCESPILLYNPTAVQILQFADYIVIKGEIIWEKGNKNLMPTFSQCAVLSGFYRGPRRHDGTSNKETDPELIDIIVKENFIYVGNTRVNLFISCDCGHCSLCKDNKRRELESRALLEAADYPCMFFYTLTYDDAHLPQCGLCPHDVSAFNTRFRELLAIRYSKRHKCDLYSAREFTSFRTFFVGEYGVDPRYTRRPHYHGILFFKNHIDDKDVKFVYRCLRDAWGKGRRYDFQKCKSPAACARYVTKYITKQDMSCVPEGKAPLFYRTPRRGGGFGASRLEDYKDAILHSTDNRIYLHIAGSVVNIKIPKFVLNKLYPTLSRVRPNLTSAFRDLTFVFDRLVTLITTKLKRSKRDPFEIPNFYLYDVNNRFSSFVSRFGYLFSSVKQNVKELSFLVGTCSRDFDKLYQFFNDCLAYLESACPVFDDFKTMFFPKLEWQNRLQFPDSPFKERLQARHAISLNNVNYVLTHHMTESYFGNFV